MSKSNPRAKCLVCRLVNQMDEVRKHPNRAGLRGVASKLAQIREYTDMESWCPEHTKNYRDVSYLVEHWANRLERQLNPIFKLVVHPEVVGRFSCRDTRPDKHKLECPMCKMVEDGRLPSSAAARLRV